MKKLKVLELFSGTECLSNAFRERGHECFTVDYDEQFPSSLHKDISKLTTEEIIEKFGYPDIIFLGIDCTSYSVAAISKHRRKNERTGNLDPISEYAKFCDNMAVHCRKLIKELNPKIQIWENPRGALRKMWFMQDLICQTTSYCQYGMTYMKPTDFFSNINLYLKPVCKNGMKCHQTAKRGARTGLQGIKDKKIKAMYPKMLCEHFVDVCEDYIFNKEFSEDCRSCLHITEKCKDKEKCKNYMCKYNLNLRLDMNDPVVLYNETNLHEQCKNCNNLWSSMECEMCENFDMYKEV